MSDYSPSYLSRLNAFPENFARFITRIPGVEVSLDREGVISALTPAHEKVMQQGGIDPKYLRRAQQVHGNRVADCCLGIYVADCAAVWVYDTVSGSRGLVHSGKRGTEQNIVSVLFARMHKVLGVQARNCIAVISPCVRPPHYEVDLPPILYNQLQEAGVLPENIVDSGLDTAADLETFYSYRAEKGCTGRMLALFGRRSPADRQVGSLQ